MFVVIIDFLQQEYISRDGDIQAWNESSLIHWVLDNFSQPVARIMPMWRKAFDFERYVDGNPILMLFTPLNPLYEQLPSYALVNYFNKNICDIFLLLFINFITKYNIDSTQSLKSHPY